MNKRSMGRMIGLLVLLGLLVTGLARNTSTVNAEASWAAGRLDMVVRGGDNQIYHKYYQGGWSGWQAMGSPPGGATSDPTAVSWGYQRLDMFVRGADNALWHKSWTPAGWSGWISRGGNLAGGADAASWAAGRLDLVARGGDNTVHHLWYQDGIGWGAWESLGGTTYADPTAVSWGPDRLDIFARGTDNALYHKLWTPAGWSLWVYLGGIVVGGPDVASFAPGHLDIYVRSTDNQIHHIAYEGGAWQSWASIGGALTSDPSAVSWGPGSMDIFARGTDNALQHRHYENGWGPWESLGLIPGFAPPVSFQDEVINLTNQQRAAYGCPALYKNGQLTAAAQGHSQDMSTNNFFNHTGTGGSTLLSRTRAAGYTGWTSIGENIAAGQTTPAQVVNDWMNSSPHRANILNCSFRSIGVGYVYEPADTFTGSGPAPLRHYWTQDFGNP